MPCCHASRTHHPAAAAAALDPKRATTMLICEAHSHMSINGQYLAGRRLSPLLFLSSVPLHRTSRFDIKVGLIAPMRSPANLFYCNAVARWGELAL